ncbi:MAG: hypothetical protein VZR31_05730 [Lachnospiraceae bacterium]|nr:hypothetical protein [Lachnospiraceae bacterium]
MIETIFREEFNPLINCFYYRGKWKRGQYKILKNTEFTMALAKITKIEKCKEKLIKTLEEIARYAIIKTRNGEIKRGVFGKIQEKTRLFPTIMLYIF